jgi:hypothetical protein
MGQICHAHNCRAVQKNETHPTYKGRAVPPKVARKEEQCTRNVLSSSSLPL